MTTSDSRVCREVLRHGSKSFHAASLLLPPRVRNAASALYAFCRVTDDIVDRPDGDVRASLRSWRRRALADHPPENDPIAVAWADARLRYQVPLRYAEQLIDGVERDLSQSRYETFEDLAAYSYGVASTVGLMSMHITGFSESAAVRYAIKLGVALQLTNILRDVGEDWRRGRLYLPLEELHRFGLSEADLAKKEVSDRWRAFMQFQIARNHRLYDEAWPGIGLLHRDGRLAIGAAATFYRGILTDIEKHDYNVFSRRAHVGKWRKLQQLPSIWWRSGSFSRQQWRTSWRRRVQPGANWLSAE